MTLKKIKDALATRGFKVAKGQADSNKRFGISASLDAGPLWCEIYNEKKKTWWSLEIKGPGFYDSFAPYGRFYDVSDNLDLEFMLESIDKRVEKQKRVKM